MIYLSDRSTPTGIYAIVTIDDQTRIILGIRIVPAASPPAPLATPQEADDFDLSDPAVRP